MIIGLTYDLKTDWQKDPDDPLDANAELDNPQTIEDLSAAFEARGHQVVRIGNARNLIQQIDTLDVDIVFNICEGHHGRNRESEVPLLLEMYGIPFVGADALSLGVTLDKVIAKKCFIADGISTPRYFVAHHSKDLKTLNKIGFPLIVKPSREGSSKGLSEKSRVTDEAGLKAQVELINTVYKQPALIEEFIKGTEFTVAVVGNDEPTAMPSVQVSIDGVLNLGDDFYTFSRLLNSDRVQYICPAPISPELEKKLQALAIQAYKSVDCRDFGRVDFRVDEKGNPFVLEINPLPCLAKNDVFYFTAKSIGIGYEDMINKILGFAVERQGLNNAKPRANRTAVHFAAKEAKE